MDLEQFTVEKHPDKSDVNFLNDRINEFNFATTGVKDGGELAIFVRDDSGSILAGLYGWTWGGTLHIQYLWVDEALRGKGYGRRILETAEAEGKARGCRQAILSTHSFQAPDFYRKRGYEIRGTYDDYPVGHQKLYLRKALL